MKMVLYYVSTMGPDAVQGFRLGNNGTHPIVFTSEADLDRFCEDYKPYKGATRYSVEKDLTTLSDIIRIVIYRGLEEIYMTPSEYLKIVQDRA